VLHLFPQNISNTSILIIQSADAYLAGYYIWHEVSYTNSQQFLIGCVQLAWHVKNCSVMKSWVSW